MLGPEASILNKKIHNLLPLWSCSLLEVGRNRPLPNYKCKITGVITALSEKHVVP